MQRSGSVPPRQNQVGLVWLALQAFGLLGVIATGFWVFYIAFYAWGNYITIFLFFGLVFCFYAGGPALGFAYTASFLSLAFDQIAPWFLILPYTMIIVLFSMWVRRVDPARQPTEDQE